MFFYPIHICQADEITDIKIIKYADMYSGSKIVLKLEKMYKLKGSDALKPFIPAISERCISMINKHEENNSLNDAEGEYLGSLLTILSISGDANAKSALLRAMISKKVGGLVVSKGLMKLGPSVLPDIKLYLDDKDQMVVGNTISTLKDISLFDSTGMFFSQQDKNEFREYLLKQLKIFHPSLKFYIISALRYFGNKTTINILEEIKNSDGFVKDGVYINKIWANDAIIEIKKRYP